MFLCMCVFLKARFFLNWSIVDLQYYVSLRCTIQWFKIFIDYTPFKVIMASWENLQTTNAGEGVEKGELSCTVGGNVNWYSHYGEQYGGSLKN